MVFDKLEFAGNYYGLGKGIETVLRHYAQYCDDGKALPEEVQLDGEKIFVMGVNYRTGDELGTELEFHTNYVDVMYVVEGEEKFYWKPTERVSQVTVPYDAEDDCTMTTLDKDAAQVRFPAGYFCVFFPQDAHCAAQPWDTPCKVRKFIAKVRLDTL